MTEKPDIREKVLKYLKVMSRPINFSYQNKQSPIWSYLYVDLADRRLSNWLWTKFEGIRQREVFLDHVKRRAERLQLQHTSMSHMLLQETHVSILICLVTNWHMVITGLWEIWRERELQIYDYSVFACIWKKRGWGLKFVNFYEKKKVNSNGLQFNLTGVAGVDVPIKSFQAKIPHDKVCNNFSTS